MVYDAVIDTVGTFVWLQSYCRNQIDLNWFLFVQSRKQLKVGYDGRGLVLLCMVQEVSNDSSVGFRWNLQLALCVALALDALCDEFRVGLCERCRVPPFMV